MAEFSIRDLTRAGFERVPSKDFRDDGNAFKVLMKDGLEVTYLKSDGEYFVDIHVSDIGHNFTWYDMSQEPWYKLTGEFNGTCKVDVNKLIENIETINKGIKDLEKKIDEVSIDRDALMEVISKEIEIAENAVIYFKSNYDWYNNYKDTFNIQRVHSFEATIAEVKTQASSYMRPKDIRILAQRLDRYGHAYGVLDPKFIYSMCEKNN